MQIKVANKFDIPTIFEIHRSAIIENLRGDYPSAILRQWEEKKDSHVLRYEADLRRSGEEVILILDGHDSLGFLSFKSSYLSALYVRPGHMRKGLGSRMFRYYESKVRNDGISQFTFNCPPSSVGFYLNHDCKIVHEFTHRLGPSHFMKAFRMEKRLA